MVPAAAVTTHAKPVAQQQLARDLQVVRASMGQRCRRQKFRRGAARQSPATSTAGFLLTSALLLYSQRTWGYCSWSSPTDQPARKFKDSLGINIMTI